MGRKEYRTVSLPASLVDEVEQLTKKVGFWPTKTDFIREAVLEKLEKCKVTRDAEGEKRRRGR